MKKSITFIFCLLLSCVLLQAQVINKALSFAGTTNSKVSFGDINALDNVSLFTFEAWIYIEEWKANSYVFVKEGATWKHKISMQLGYKPDGTTKRLYFHVSNGENMYAAIDAPAISTGQWHHIAVAYDGSASGNQMDIFIDGALANEWYSGGAGSLPALTASGSGSFDLGAGGFSGKIDEVRLWNTKLTAAQLDYKNTINSYHPLYNHLIAYWKMDQADGSVIDSKGSQHGTPTNASLVSVTDNTAFVYRIVSTYIRSNFYETGRISQEALRNNNDIVYLACNPYANGDLFFEYPENHGVLNNAGYLASFGGRNGVMDFQGNGAVMNGGKGLLNKATGGATAFTFATWIYIDNWVENSSIFRKYSSATSRIDLQLGSAMNSTLNLYVANGSNNYVQLNNSGLSTGTWHHIAVTYSGNSGANNQVKIYIDGVSKSGLIYSAGNGLLPTSGPFIKSDFELGVNFDGKMDETSVNLLSLGASEISSIKNNPLSFSSWNASKTAAYWKYDNAANPGYDSRTWVGVLDDLKEDLAGMSGAHLRLGLSGGDWKVMMQTETARNNFAQQVKDMLQAKGFDGVDLDFEWCETTLEWTNYNLTIAALRTALGSNPLFSVTLHPLYYKISTAAMNHLDFISIQSYGPSPERFPYNEFVSNITSMQNYGFPANKLVMGLPFYGTTADKVTTGYFDIIKVNPTLDPALDQVSMTLNGAVKTVIFNGQNTIINKTKYVRDQALAGVMYWDIATDVDVTQSLSLLRALNSAMNANLASVVQGTLPVQLSAFMLKAGTKEVDLHWITESEFNSDLFVIERSMDGLSFKPINTLKAAGNSLHPTTYTYRDLSPEKGTAYYRLRQTDLNGEFVYSAIRAVNLGLEAQATVRVHPNPASSFLFIEGLNSGPKEICLTDLAGREVLRMDKPGNEIAIPLVISPGMYILTIQSNDNKISWHKVLIKR